MCITFDNRILNYFSVKETTQFPDARLKSERVRYNDSQASLAISIYVYRVTERTKYNGDKDDRFIIVSLVLEVFGSLLNCLLCIHI